MTQSSIDIDAINVTRVDEEDAERQHGSLWFMFLAGPVVYMLYFIGVWVLGEFGCLAGIQQLRLFGSNPITLGIVVLTAVAALTTLIVGIFSFRRWRQLRAGSMDSGEADPKFMLFVATWLNGIFTVVTLLTPISMLLGSSCSFI